jgi:hypothetical protein
MKHRVIEELMEIKCLLCSGTFEDNDTGMQEHFKKRHYPIELGLMHYVIALQKQLEDIKGTYKDLR